MLEELGCVSHFCGESTFEGGVDGPKHLGHSRSLSDHHMFLLSKSKFGALQKHNLLEL